MIDVMPPRQPLVGLTFSATVEDSEHAYLRGSWSEAYKLTGRNAKLPWPIYKQHVVPELAAVLAAADTRLLLVRRDGMIVGWIAYVPGRSVDTVHWIHTRYRIGEGGDLLRRRGVMTALFEAANIGQRVVYTHRGPMPRHRGGAPSDVWLTNWLAGRGTSAIHVPYEEWRR